MDANGKIAASATGLLPGKTYYIRTYARNTTGTGYGEQSSSSTLDLNTFTGDVELGTQHQVDSFAALHYNRIKGTLVVYGTVTDLTPLSELVAITKELNISHTTQLSSLDGLQNITTVNSDNTQNGLLILFNDGLQDLAGLEGITEVTGAMTIGKNYNLTSLDGLNNFNSLKSGTLTIEGCSKLASLNGLENLETVSSQLVIWDNEVLADVSALEHLSSLKSLSIAQNPALTNVDGLESLTNLEHISLFHCYALSSLSGFKNIATAGNIQIDSTALINLSGLENLTSISDLFIANSSELTDITALSAVNTLTILKIYGSGLKDLKGLEGVSNFNSVEIYHNDKLESLEGLNNVDRIESYLNVVGNPNLSNLQALTATEVYSAYFEDNSLLVDFCPLKNSFANPNSGSLTTINNGANPTKEDIVANCP